MKRIALGTTVTLVGLTLALAAPATAQSSVGPSSGWGQAQHYVNGQLQPPAPAVVDQDPAEAMILQRTNAVRATDGRTALTRNTRLDAVAAAWATQMATTGDFRHNPNYSTQIPAGWRAAGENIAWNSYDPAALATQWEQSAGHRANMVNPSFTHIGIGVVQYNGRYYGVQVFGGYPNGLA
ncbi:CAP domain-containing protein [Cellulomonas taurus]|uniref:CAP domain-containing protein n=1 Tax=Cellulomonas taurus TaxID=2729175 RepID=UPI00145CB4BF|nr:CAP domain-containing protein [Cellulomonas taurus]